MTDHAEDPTAAMARKDRLLREHEHDTYKTRHKLPEPTVCPQCAAVYQQGRWRWAAAPPGANEEICPACHRIADKYPGGTVALSGEFFEQHREELLNLARNEEERAKAEHPLQRIIAIEESGDGALITTTDQHLARGIGAALQHACRGELDYHYVEESKVLSVTWKR
jgi:NMD protein affecting ribosome stability and mRNA decay